MRNYEIIRSYNDGKGNLYRFTEQNKNGNEYTVGLFNEVTKEYTHRSFKTIDEALTVYKTLVELIVKGYGTEEYKRNVLKGE